MIEHRFIYRELKNENYEDLIIKYIDHNALFMYDLEKNGKKLFFSNINYFENEEGEELALVYYTDVTALYSDNNLKSIDDFALNTDLPLILKNYCDSLTNIPNSNFFISLADKLIHELNDSGKQMAFVSFSLMDFRNFNERYGVNEGNKVLVTLASALESVFSKKRCARIEGNIFAACGDKTLRSVRSLPPRRRGGSPSGPPGCRSAEGAASSGKGMKGDPAPRIPGDRLSAGAEKVPHRLRNCLREGCPLLR